MTARSQRTPAVSLGLPVRNGERWLAAALGSLRAQRFDDFELLVADNASTDRTPEIARAFAAVDRRVRVVRHERNLGAAANFGFVLAEARAPLFKWMACDDVLAPEYLGACVAALAQEPGAAVAHSRTGAIDARGRTVGEYREPRFEQERPSDRFRALIRLDHGVFAIFGVMRTALVRRAPGIAPFVGSDRNTLAELGLHGPILEVPALLFQRRAHADASVARFPDEWSRLAWFDPARAGRRSFPTWRRLGGHLASIARVPLAAGERARCVAALAAWLGDPHHRGGSVARALLDDLAGSGRGPGLPALPPARRSVA